MDSKLNLGSNTRVPTGSSVVVFYNVLVVLASTITGLPRYTFKKS